MFSPKDRDKCWRLFAKYYRGRKFHDTLYTDVILRHLRPGQRVLDAGCGRYMKFCKDLSPRALVVGIDLERALETRNHESPFGVRGDLNQLPFRSGYFNLVISRSVVEHLADPVAVFREFARVLHPGGKVVIVTPNKYDYVSFLAAITPYRFHRFLVAKIMRVPEGDVFPTLYRANTASALRKSLRMAGMAELELELVNHYPAYLMFSPVLFRLGVCYERLTSRALFRSLRGLILCVFQKPEQPVGEKPRAVEETAATGISQCK
jgi:ubiquinone/menaquinone biosynthesis C-methylase UbiE